MTYSEGTASVSCVDSTSSAHRYQVILLQQNNPNRVVVVNVSSSGPTNAPVTPGGRYCIMVLQEEDNEVRYSSEFIAGDISTTNTTQISSTKIVTHSNSARSSIGCKNKVKLIIVTN